MLLQGLTALLFVCLLLSLLLVLMRSGRKKDSLFSSRRSSTRHYKTAKLAPAMGSARRRRTLFWSRLKFTPTQQAAESIPAASDLPSEASSVSTNAQTGVLEDAVQATLSEACALATAHAAEDKANSLAKESRAPEYIALYLLAEPSRPYRGYELLQALLASGLRYGEQCVFSYYPSGDIVADPLFYCASLQQPGTFDLPNMGGYSCNGLSFCFSVQDSLNPVLALEELLKTAHCMMQELGGVLVDSKKQALTTDGIEKMRAQMAQAMPRLQVSV